MITLRFPIKKAARERPPRQSIWPYGLARLGCRVLLVDLDPQSSLTMAVGANTNQGNMADVLRELDQGDCI